jgi:FimV-like protein
MDFSHGDLASAGESTGQKWRRSLVFQRVALFLLLWTLACTSVSADEHRADAPTAGHRVTGVLVSESGRSSAIVNGKLTQAGDRVDGAEVLAIVVGAVRLRRGSQETTVFVGSTAAWETSTGPAADVSFASSKQLLVKAPMPSAGLAVSEPRIFAPASAPDGAPANARANGMIQYGPVQAGETLSEIAEHYLPDEMTMNQMMIGLFEANPEAFRGNINVLLAGANLRIPETNELRRQAPATATALVARHRVDWANAAEPQLALTPAPSHETYGPVARGETLSGVTETILPEGVTRHQLMIALLETNPQAFSGNINVLHAGAILRIPDVESILRRPPATAAAEVIRQSDSWRTGLAQQARSTTSAERQIDSLARETPVSSASAI